MEGDAFGRGLGPPMRKVPTFTSFSQQQRVGESSASLNDQPSISSQAASTSKLRNIKIPSLIQPHSLLETTQAPRPFSDKLPDIPLKEGKTAPKRERPRSQEPSAGPSTKSISGGSSISSTPSLPSSFGNGATRSGPMPGSSPRASSFDGVVIPLTSSPVSALTESLNSRKRAYSISQGASSKRQREEPPKLIIPRTGNGSGKGKAAKVDDDQYDPQGEAKTSKNRLVIPPSSQNQKGKAKASNKGKGTDYSKVDPSQFHRPTRLESFLVSDSAENYTELLAEVNTELKDARARAKQKAQDEIVPLKASELKRCPFCPSPWPEKASDRLIRLAQPLLDKLHKNAKIEPGTRMGMCSLHNDEASIIPQGKAQGWPAAKDFVWDFWEEIFFEGKRKGVDGEFDWIMRQMCDRVINPSSSQWLRACQEKAAKDGARTVTSAKGLMESMEEEQTGYFGEVGAAKMLEWLRRAFIDQRIPESNNPYPDSDLRLDADHKQASLHPLNSTSFISRCLVPELACCFIKVLDGCDFEEANQTRLQSSAYGSAILPVLAEDDVGQFLDFDLDRDTNDTGRTPPSSAGRLSAPNTPSRRSRRIEATVGSSPAARQKEKKESSQRGSQRGRPKSSQTRRGRKAAGADSVVDDESVEIVATGRSKAAEAAEDPNQAPPSSMGSNFRPKARPLQRTISTASARSYLDDSDDDMSLPSGSQHMAPASSQPPSSQRPQPRPFTKRSHGSDSDSDAAVASQSSFSKAKGKKRKGPPHPRESFEIISNPSQSRSESRGPPAGSSKGLLEMAGSSQEPISLLGSEDSELHFKEDGGHAPAVGASSGTKLYPQAGLDQHDFLEVSAADTDLFPLSQGSAGLDEFQAPPSAQPPRIRSRAGSASGEQWYPARVSDPARAPNVSPQSHHEARVDPQRKAQGPTDSDEDAEGSVDSSYNEQSNTNDQSNTTAAHRTSPGGVRDPRLASAQQQYDTRPGHPSLPHSSAADVDSGRSSLPISRPDTPPFRLTPGTRMSAGPVNATDCTFGNVNQQRQVSRREMQTHMNASGDYNLAHADPSRMPFPLSQNHRQPAHFQGQPYMDPHQVGPQNVIRHEGGGHHGQMYASQSHTSAYGRGDQVPSGSQSSVGSNSTVRAPTYQDQQIEGFRFVPPSEQQLQQPEEARLQSAYIDAPEASSSQSSWEIGYSQQGGSQTRHWQGASRGA
ncbi:hypothetical protein CF327_g4759 [Tilletia walkeri]|nr:hypothetical protein CF327_g4759 [Tilletia walkeri]